jgi:hypothetical protein
MTTYSFRVPNFPIRGCSLTKRQRVSLVRKAMAAQRAAEEVTASKTSIVATQKTLKEK